VLWWRGGGESGEGGGCHDRRLLVLINKVCCMAYGL